MAIASGRDTNEATAMITARQNPMSGPNRRGAGVVATPERRQSLDSEYVQEKERVNIREALP
jgi:hypothetical protein